VFCVQVIAPEVTVGIQQVNKSCQAAARQQTKRNQTDGNRTESQTILTPELMMLIDAQIREDVEGATSLLISEIRRVSSDDEPYASLLKTNHPYWATRDDVDSELAIDRKFLDTLAGYLLYYIHGESFGGRGGMAPHITNGLVWFELPDGLFDADGEHIDVSAVSLATLVEQVTVESVLRSLDEIYNDIEDIIVSVDIRPGDKNPRCWNISSNNFSFAIGLLLHVLCTNPFCADGIALTEKCATILDSNTRTAAVAVRSC
jgi:hypothetical protein